MNYMTYDDLIDDFAASIKNKIREREDRYGSDWKTDSVAKLFDHLINEYSEAIDELKDSNYKELSEEMIDVAACAMLVWNAAWRDMERGT